MDRWLQYTQEQIRSFDIDSAMKDAMNAIAWLASDLMGGSQTVVSNSISATANGTLTISLGAGRIYQLANADTANVAGGVLNADTTQILQQGWAGSQSITLSTSGLTAGQSRWALIEAGFTQIDGIRANDPSSGLLNFYNSTNPSQPLQGQGGNGQTLPTVRQGLCNIKVVYGIAATTGSEVPPNADAGYVGLYLIDLAYGQTAVSQGNVLTAGPSVGTGVPSNYPQAPFLEGQIGTSPTATTSHHGGINGQAPKINLASEVQGKLSPVNMNQIRTVLNAPTTYHVSTAGNDTTGNGSLANPWATLQKAYTYLQSFIDAGGQVITISVADGTYSAGLVVNGPIPGIIGPGSIVFSGTVNAVINNTADSAFVATYGASFSLQGFTIECSGNPSRSGVIAQLGGEIILNGGHSFGSCPSAHVLASLDGSVAIQGNYTIAAGAGYHFLAQNAGSIDNSSGARTITITGTPAFTAFARANNNGVMEVPNLSFSGSATGDHYETATGGGIDTGGGGATYFPGSTTGTSTGWYA